jgi:tetratricopeptide (TPR) repeat protein
VLAAHEKTWGPENRETLGIVNNLGSLYYAQGRYSEAEPLLDRALTGNEKTLGPEHPETLASVNSLGLLYERQGRYGEAEPVLKRALTGYEKTLGPEHPLTLTSINSLGSLYRVEGRYGETEPLLKRALAGNEKALGPEHPETLTSVDNFAAFSFAQRDWQGAAQYWRRSTAAIAKHVRRGAQGAGLIGKTKSEAQQFDWQFWGLIKAAYRLAPEDRAPGAASEMFETAQWALSSEAARSLAQMAARGAKGDPALAALVRERQDLVDEWQGREKLQAAALGQETAKRNAEVEFEDIVRMGAIDRRIAEIDVELKVKFPDYAALASPVPLAVQDVQAQLAADEALVLFLDTPEWQPTPEETFIWVVTKTQMRWLRSDLGKAELTSEVAALRCGLDRAAWEGQSPCIGLTGQSRLGKLLPFDHGRAYRLYEALFGEAADLIKGKHLLIVPSGALTQLPFAVLVTAPPKGDNKAAAWLARDHAITMLPAVSSLKALRATGRPSAAAKPLIGFGNPLLNGGDESSPAAKLTREKQACPKTAWQRGAALFGFRQAVAPIETRDGLADVSLIRSAAPLPETADELCAVASDMGADISEIRLGARATEREVKTMSAADKLAQYRVIHFATHGAMAGELSQGVEPGLILTPPDAASEEDG